MIKKHIWKIAGIALIAAFFVAALHFLPAKPAEGAGAYVQSAFAKSSGTLSLTATFPNPPTAGNLVVVAISTWRSLDPYLAQISSVTDNQGNTYQQAAMQVISAGQAQYLYVYYAKNIAYSSGAFSVTASLLGPGNEETVMIEEISGVDAQDPFDQWTAANVATNMTNTYTLSTPSITTAYNGEFFFLAESQNITATSTPQSPFTRRQMVGVAGSNIPLTIADMTSDATTTSGNVVLTFSGSTLAGAGSILVVFKKVGVSIGYLDSETFDTGITNGAQYNSMMWNGNQPAGTTVDLQLAVSNSSSGPWTYYGPGGATSTYYTYPAGTPAPLDYNAFNNYRYYRYRITLHADPTGTQTPRVDDVLVNWSP